MPPQEPTVGPAQGLTADILGELRHNVGDVLQQAQSPVRQAAGPIGAAMSVGDLLTGLARGLTVPLAQRDPGAQSLTPQHVRQRGNLLGDILSGLIPLGGAGGKAAKVGEEAAAEVPEIIVHAKPKMEQFFEDLRAGSNAAYTDSMPKELARRKLSDQQLKWASDWVKQNSKWGLTGEEGQNQHIRLWKEAEQHPEYLEFDRQKEAHRLTDQELMEKHRPLSEAVQKHLPPGWTVRREILKDWAPGYREVKHRVFDDQGRLVLGDTQGIDRDIWERIINEGRPPQTGAEAVRELMRQEGLNPANDTQWDELQQFFDENLKGKQTGEVKPFPPGNGMIGQ